MHLYTLLSEMRPYIFQHITKLLDHIQITCKDNNFNHNSQIFPDIIQNRIKCLYCLPASSAAVSSYADVAVEPEIAAVECARAVGVVVGDFVHFAAVGS